MCQESREHFLNELEKISSTINLKEGVSGLIQVLSLIHQYPRAGSKIYSQKSNLPVPIVVAIRNEFSKRKWCVFDKGAMTTDLGKKVLESILGPIVNITCLSCDGYGVVIDYSLYSKQLEKLRKYCSLRGTPNTQIDQSFATPETSLSRVLFMLHKQEHQKKNFALVGDSDLTSVALSLLLPSDCKIVVFDIDVKVQELITLANTELENQIEFVHHDLRHPIPLEYLHQFDCIHTDPPYTATGVSLFLSRAIQLCSTNLSASVYLSFVTKPPDEMLIIQKDFSMMNCLLTDILPRFNRYIGADKLGSVSTLYRFRVLQDATPSIPDYFADALYTGEINPILRYYKCKNCNEVVLVGIRQHFTTIENLKDSKCPKCRGVQFIKVKEKRAL